ncbi:right-handed parallel beta-helix repeat-containing protein [Nonomuraea ceibae]|uniref:right-handed parallel beta-helix repeat-containing protein n=1 Tax=Nonomuraea ceibae TaxID=1935170 RepID=UPI001C5CECC0|nr:right-handed parallel beta-helix repeat-containing protein [Nonomuraea ceibae]
MNMSRRAALAAGVLGGAAAVTAGGAAAAQAASAEPGPNPLVAGESASVRRLRTLLNLAARGDRSLERDAGGRCVVVASPGVHVLKRPLVIGGDTTLRADGATFTSDVAVKPQTYYKDKNQHSPEPTYPDSFVSVAAVNSREATLLINAVPDDCTGHRAPGNIRLEGGIWDPTAHFVRNATGDDRAKATDAPPMNAITFEHTHHVELHKVTVRNVKWWHGVELNAVRTATVSECRFEGWIEAPTAGLWHGEAVQLDVATTGTTWGGVADNTPATDIRVIDSYCGRSQDYPGWGKIIGSHTGAPGAVHSDVWIERNLIEHAKWDAIGPMNTSRVVIRENTIRSCWGGVYVKSINPNPNETVDIMGNDITLVDGSTRPAVGVNATNAQLPVSDVAVYANIVSGGGFSYSANVTFRREPQR